MYSFLKHNRSCVDHLLNIHCVADCVKGRIQTQVKLSRSDVLFENAAAESSSSNTPDHRLFQCLWLVGGGFLPKWPPLPKIYAGGSHFLFYVYNIFQTHVIYTMCITHVNIVHMGLIAKSYMSDSKVHDLDPRC